MCIAASDSAADYGYLDTTTYNITTFSSTYKTFSADWIDPFGCVFGWSNATTNGIFVVDPTRAVAPYTVVVPSASILLAPFRRTFVIKTPPALATACPVILASGNIGCLSLNGGKLAPASQFVVSAFDGHPPIPAGFLKVPAYQATDASYESTLIFSSGSATRKLNITLSNSTAASVSALYQDSTDFNPVVPYYYPFIGCCTSVTRGSSTRVLATYRGRVFINDWVARTQYIQLPQLSTAYDFSQFDSGGFFTTVGEVIGDGSATTPEIRTNIVYVPLECFVAEDCGSAAYTCVELKCVAAAPSTAPVAAPMAPPVALPPPIASTIACSPPKPSTAAYCADGVWIVPSGISINSTGSTTANGTSAGTFTVETRTTVLGNLTIDVPPTTVAVAVRSGATIDVQGCVSLSGTIVIDLDQKTIDQDNGTVSVLTYQGFCDSSKTRFDNISVTTSGLLDPCYTLSYNSTYTSQRLSVLFDVSSNCAAIAGVGPGAIAGIVVAAVVVASLIIGAIVFIRRRRNQSWERKFGTVAEQESAAVQVASEADASAAVAAGGAAAAKKKSKASKRKSKHGDTEYGAIAAEQEMDTVMLVEGDSASVFSIPYSSIQLIQELGRGSYGTVHLGMWEGQFCAVKMLNPGAVTSAQAEEFAQEARLMHSLKKHPCLTEMFGMCIEAGKYAVVMEFCPLGSLESYLKARRKEKKSAVPKLDTYTLFKLIYGVSDGMAALASQGVVHRDLAARNILLGDGSVPKIADFGYSRKLENQEEKGKTDTKFGPIRWMSPEAIRGTYSEKSDVWSFGAAIIEMLTGEVPYSFSDDISSVATLALQIRDEGRNPLEDFQIAQKKHRVACPPWLTSLLESCFENDPAARPSFKTIVKQLKEANPLLSVKFQNELEDPERIISAAPIIPVVADPSSASTSTSTHHSKEQQSSSSYKRKSADSKGKTIKGGLKSGDIDVSRLKLLSKLGEGSFGAVFLGQVDGNRYVAVKQLVGDAVSSGIHREASIMASLPPHRNVVGMYGLVVDGARYSLVMEFVARGSLETFVSKSFKSASHSLLPPANRS